MKQEEKWLLEDKYEGVKTPEFLADCERLAAGEPLGYVIGYVPFLGCKIWLDSHPLIPRPETEFWTEKAIEEINKRQAKIEEIKKTVPEDFSKPPQQFEKLRGLAEKNPLELFPLKILDLCAGSGCVGVAVAKHAPMASVDFAEIDAPHLPTIKKNLKENTIIYDSKKYSVFQSDLFDNLHKPFSEMEDEVILDEKRGVGEFSKEPYPAYGEEKIGTHNEADRQNYPVFDFILTNPPYIDPILDRTEPSVKNHEPHHALYGGENGMEFIEHIIANAKMFLNPNGQLWIEHEPEQSIHIYELAEKFGFKATTHKDQYDIERYTILMLQ